MTHGGSALSRTLHILALATILWMPLAGFADEYGDVMQLMRSGKPAEALARADRYIAAKPRDPQMRFLKGVIQSETGRTAEAIATFTELTQEYPELPEPYNNLAVLYAGHGEYDKARAALELAIRTNPGYATAHENLGDVYAQLASQAYARAQQLDARNTSVLPKLALIRQLLSPAESAAAKPAAAGASSSATGGKRPGVPGG
jgi:tetratricopeptide (TPR) repeat protein